MTEALGHRYVERPPDQFMDRITGFALGMLGGSVVVERQISSLLERELHSGGEMQPPSIGQDAVIVGEDVGIILAPAVVGAVAVSAIASRVRRFRHRYERMDRVTKKPSATDLESWPVLGSNPEHGG